MPRTDLTDLSAFIAVAEQLSFRAAANKLGVTPSALSHRMRQLEAHVGVRLLHRTTRSVAPTDAGRRLLEQVRPAMEQISDALTALSAEQDRPSGRLRIFAAPMASMMVVAPIWNKFLERYPAIQLEIGGYGALQDIVARGYDAGIAPREFLALDMTAVRVTRPMKIAVAASPAYLAQHPAIKSPEDLKAHNCIQYRLPVSGTVVNWTFARKRTSRPLSCKTDVVTTSGTLIVDDVDLALRAAVDGIGIAYTLESSAEFFLRSGHLVRVLEDWSPNFDGLYLYYPGNRNIPAALRAFVDMVKTSYAGDGRRGPEIPFIERMAPSLQPRPGESVAEKPIRRKG